MGKLLSTRSKLLLALLTAGLVSILVIGYLAWSSARTTILQGRQEHLTSVRTAKAQHVESYFTNLEDQIHSLAEDETVIRAMVQLNRAFRQLNHELIPDSWNDTLAAYYEADFMPRLRANAVEEPTLAFYLPQTPAAQYLQYHYIAANEHPSGEKALLDDAGDQSEYNQFHQQYHPFFRSLIERHHYHDLLLVDLETQQVVYSAAKEVDFASAPLVGANSEGELARVIEQVLATPEKGVAQIVDYDYYPPSSDVLVSFVAIPIFNGLHMVGILAIQFSTTDVDQIVTSAQGWGNSGQGATGEVYIVGANQNMRSTSRFLVENQADYFADLRSAGQPEQNIALIEQFGTSILFQQVNSESAREAVAGRNGTNIEKDYRGHTTLTSYSPLNIRGLNWGIVAQMDETEVLAPVEALLRQMLIAGVILIGLITFLSILAARTLTQPIQRLLTYTRKAHEGELDVPSTLVGDGEFGELAQTISELTQETLEQSTQLERKNLENESLLHNIIPPPIAHRIQAGEEKIVDQHLHVSILYAHITGLVELSEEMSAGEVSRLITQLLDEFDAATERLELELHHTNDTDYMAICGLNIPHLDHVKRSVDLAIEMHKICRHFDSQISNGQASENQRPAHHTIEEQRHPDDLQERDGQAKETLGLQIGIHTGAVTAGVISGNRRFGYYVWGDAVRKATSLHLEIGQDSIVLTTDAYERVSELYDFVSHSPHDGLWILNDNATDRSSAEEPPFSEEPPFAEEPPVAEEPSVDEELSTAEATPELDNDRAVEHSDEVQELEILQPAEESKRRFLRLK